MEILLSGFFHLRTIAFLVSCKEIIFFTLIWVTEGAGKVNADFEGYDFEANSLFTFAPYQPYVFTTTSPIKGIAIYFHFDFFCIHKHQKELEVNGILYNNVYQPPFVKVDEKSAGTFQDVV